MSDMSPTDRFAEIRASLKAAQKACDAAIAAVNRAEVMSGFPDIPALDAANEQWEAMDGHLARLLSLTETTEGQQLLDRIAAWLEGQESELPSKSEILIAAGSGVL